VLVVLVEERQVVEVVEVVQICGTLLPILQAVLVA
jgi:hypothetical protein